MQNHTFAEISAPLQMFQVQDPGSNQQHIFIKRYLAVCQFPLKTFCGIPIAAKGKFFSMALLPKAFFRINLIRKVYR
jgi:hypothetical protein